jgi:hypothetical protein
MAKNCGSLGDTDLDEAQEIEHPQSIHIWGFLKMGVPQARWMVYFMENPY